MTPLANPLVAYEMVALLLLSLGLLTLVWRRSLVGMLMGVELLLNGAGLGIVAAAQLTPQPHAPAALGQLAALLIMGLAAAEATLVLAIFIVVSRRFGHVTAEKLTLLRG